MTSEAYLINGTFTYEFETEIHAEDYDAAIEDFLGCLIVQLTPVRFIPYLQHSTIKELFRDHVEINSVDEISKEKLRQRSYQQSKENDL